MNPGYLSLWIIIILIILIATGWKPILAPDINKRSWILLGIVVISLIAVSIWLSPWPDVVHAKIHVSVCVLLLASLYGFIRRGECNNRGYTVLCTLMLAVIWGCIRKIYSFDPVFFWVDPSWDAPLLGGVLCGTFASSVKHQFSMIVWGAVLGEILNAVLQTGNYTALIGSLAWWDSFWIAFAAARLFSLMLKVIQWGSSKVSNLFWQMKGGRSS